MDSTIRGGASDEVSSNPPNYEESGGLDPRRKSSATRPFKRPGSNTQEVKKKIKVEAEDPIKQKKVYLTLDEERSLLQVLKDLALEGWRPGQIWKRGVHPKAAARVRASVEGSNITAKNVDSKMHSWKKQYRVLHDFAKLSGVAIDPETHAVIVYSPAMWEEYGRVDSKYLQLKGKTFPYYDSWCELFGQFRATGSGTSDHGDAGRAPTPPPPPSSYYELIDDYDEGIDDSTVGGREEKVAPVMDGSASGSREKSKKTLPASQSSLTYRAGETLSNLDGVFMRAERILAEEECTIKDVSKAEKAMRVKKDLQEHPYLTLVERLRMIDHLLAHEGHYYYWTTMDAEERVEFIKVFNEGKFE